MHYLTADDIAEMNAAFVGEDVPFDFGLLESAVLRPQAAVGGIDAYPTIHEQAAAMFESLVRNHPFLDGNKRTAVSAVVVFYLLNGWRLSMSDADVVELALDDAEGRADVSEVSKRLAQDARNEFGDQET